MFFEEQRLLFDIHHRQPLLARGKGVINNGQAQGIDANSPALRAFHRAERLFDNPGPKPDKGANALASANIGIPTGIRTPVPTVKG